MNSGSGTIGRKEVLVVFLFCLASLTPVLAHATGFRLFPQSASGAGQANAFAAQADDASALFYNPAGITQIDRMQVMGGVLLAGGSTTYTNAATGAKVRGDLGGTVASPPPVHFYVAANLGLLAKSLDRFSLGLGVFSPFGLKYRWPADGPQATALTRASLDLIELRPVIAYRVSDMLSIAVGADIYTFTNIVGEGQAKVQFLSSGGPGLPPLGMPIEINGKGTTAGLNASLLFTPCLTEDKKPRCSFGFQYRSRASMNLDGAFLVNGARQADARIPFVLPQSFTFGVAYWPVRDRHVEWKVEVDLDKTDWHSFKNTDVYLSTGAVLPVPRNWEDSLSVMVGTEYRRIDPALLPNWNVTLRGGYMYSENAVPSRTFDPGVPDANSHTFSVGLGFLCKAGGRFGGVIPCGDRNRTAWYRPSGIGLDLAYQGIIYETRRIADNVPAFTTPAAVNGTYVTTQHAGVVTVRLDF